MSEKKTILIIDDEPDLLEMLCLLVEEDGLEILAASDGDEGLEMYSTHKPSLIVTDLNLPKKDGATVMEEARQMDPAVKVIMMSGGSCPPGADASLPKPIDFDRFASLVKQLA